MFGVLLVYSSLLHFRVTGWLPHGPFGRDHLFSAGDIVGL